MDKDFASADKHRRRELADFLRTRRAGIVPSQVGLPHGARKRTPGLRREDVAELAGLSVSWYSWLEQSRDINVSDESLNSIANALLLNDDERRHLFGLAKPNPFVRGTAYSGEIDLPEINRVLESFATHIPATAMGRYMNILAWNGAAGDLMQDFAVLPENRMNWAWFVFKYQPREFFVDWETFARCTLALVRADYAKYLGMDIEGAKLIEELRSEVPIFNEWWFDHEVLNVPHPRKQFVHPTRGRLQFTSSAFRLEHSPEIRIIVYSQSSD